MHKEQYIADEPINYSPSNYGTIDVFVTFIINNDAKVKCKFIPWKSCIELI